MSISNRVKLFLTAIAVSISTLTCHGTDRSELNWNLAATPEEVHFESILQGQIKDQEIILSNEAVLGDVTIIRVSASCGCIQPEISQERLSPRQKAKLKFKIVSGNESRMLKEEIAISYRNSDSHDLRILRIPISGKVESVVDIKPRRIERKGHLNEIENSQYQVVLKRGDSSLKWNSLRFLSSPDDFFNVNCSREVSGKFDVNLKLNSSLLKYGRNNGKIRIECLNGDKIVFTDFIFFEIYVEAPFEITPNSVYLSGITLKEKNRVSFKIDFRDQIGLAETVSVAPSDPQQISVEGFKYTESGVTNGVVIVQPKQEGLFNEFITVEFVKDGRSGNIKVPLIGVAADDVHREKVTGKALPVGD